jgi:uncharacterized protein RhaS with RHS repeats
MARQPEYDLVRGRQDRDRVQRRSRLCRRIGPTTPDGAVRQYDTPRTASEIRVIDGNGDATLYTSSALGLLQSITDAAGNTVSYSYDSAGNRFAPSMAR